MWRVLKVLPKNWRSKCGQISCSQNQASCESQPAEDADTASACPAKPLVTPIISQLTTTTVDHDASKILSQVDSLRCQSKSLLPSGERVFSNGGWRLPGWQSYNVLEALGVGFAILVGLRFSLKTPHGHRQEEESRKPAVHPCCPLSALMRIAHAVNPKSSHLQLSVLPETGIQSVAQPSSTTDGVTLIFDADAAAAEEGGTCSLADSFLGKKTQDPDESALAHMQHLENDFRAHVLNLEAQDLLKRRPHAAFEMFEEASELGLDSAMFNLGVCYELGEGCDQDLQLALEWYEESASRGNYAALYNMAVFHLEGRGVPVDENLGLLCMKKASDAGVREAQTYMGLYYGKNCEYELAAELFTKSAFQKHADGQYLLGLCYENGLGVEENSAKAADLFARAARSNNVDANYRLATYYEMGLGGLAEDKEQAMELYKIAAAANHPMAIKRMEQDLNKIDVSEGPAPSTKPLRSVSSSPNLSTTDSKTPHIITSDFSKVKEFIHDYLLHPGKAQLYRFHLNFDEQDHAYDVTCTPMAHAQIESPMKAW